MRRRLAYLGSGVAAFGIALWAGASSLEAAREVEELSVVVDASGEVATESGPWALAVRQPELADRVVYRLDGRTIASPEAIDVATLGPGYHFLETQLVRRGGRSQRIVDAKLAGPFGPRTDSPVCGVQVSISETALQQAVLPVVEGMVLEKLQKNPYMGPDTRFDELDLRLTPGGMRFSVVLDGHNRVAIEGWLLIRRKDERRFEIKLLQLGRVSFTGETREAADMTGAALGAAVGGPLGAVAGMWLVDDYVDRKARDEIKKAIRIGLSQASELALLPERVELVPGRPASTVELGFCDEVHVMPDGITGRLGVQPVGGTIPDGWPTPGPVSFGVVLPDDPPVSEGIRLDLSLDLVNRLLDRWAAAGLLDDLIAESDLRAQTNATLGEWTTVHLDGVDVGLPPVLSNVGGTNTGWQVGLAGLEVRLSGVDAQHWGRLSLAGRGVIEPRWDQDRGRLELSGRVDQLDVTCATVSSIGMELSDCLGPLLSLGDFERRVSEALGPGAQSLPSVDVRGLIEHQSQGALHLEELTIERPLPGVLRFRAATRSKPAG
jgi:hypothetical protein